MRMTKELAESSLSAQEFQILLYPNGQIEIGTIQELHSHVRDAGYYEATLVGRECNPQIWKSRGQNGFSWSHEHNFAAVPYWDRDDRTVIQIRYLGPTIS